MKNILKYTMMLVLPFAFAACTEEMDEMMQPTSELQFVVGDFPAYDAATRAIGTPDAGKTAWENGDHLIVTIGGNNMADQSLTLTLSIDTEGKHSWTPDKTIKYDKKVTPTLTVTAIYAPCYEVDADGNKVLKEGMQLGMTEYLEASCSESDGKVTISFKDVTRDYSRLRIAGAANATYTVATTGFTPVGNGTAPADGYSLTTDEIGNAYLYGMWENGSVTVVNTDLGVNETKNIGTTIAQKSYVLDAIPTHTCDETTNTYYVYKVDGLYAWNEAAQNDLSTNLVLMADITLPTVAEGESNWTPVGNSSNFYTGTIEGNGHSISGLTINSEIVSAGFVGCAQNATIQNLSLTQVNVTASNPVNVGGIVGYAENSTISGCAVTGNLTATGSTGFWLTIGGIAGWVHNTDVTDCKNEAILTSSAEFTSSNGYTATCAMGGITGKSFGSSINGCTNTGSVTGGSTTNENTTAATGGIVGQYEGVNCTIGEYQYYHVMHKNTNSGSVTGGSATTIYTGGLVGMETSMVSVYGDISGGSVVFSCNTNSGTVKDKDGTELNYLVGGSATGDEGSETYQPLTTLTDCDGSCSSASGE